MLRDAGHSDFTDSRVELLGGESEVTFHLGVRHADKAALEPLRRESAAATVSMAQGGVVAPGTVHPVVGSFCFLLPKSEVPCAVDTGAGSVPCAVPVEGGFVSSRSSNAVVDAPSLPSGPTTRLVLRQLCWARSGDKGNSANIGLIARRPEYLPLLRQQVTPDRVRMFFQPDCKGKVERFELPGISALNFLLHETLGGGGTSSLHLDPLAKTYGQRLLEMVIDAPPEWFVAPAKL